MSGRWYFNSAIFRSAPSSDELGSFDEETREKLQSLQITCYYPVLAFSEKLLMVLDYCQLFGLLWIMAQPWPWPYLWLDYTRFIVYTNIDLFSTTEDGALLGRSSRLISRWGSMNNYPQYAIIFASVQFAIFCLALLLLSKWDIYGKIIQDTRHRILTILLLISYIIYLPCSLATFRLYYCEDNNTLSADPSIQCFNTEHILYLTLCSFFTLPVFFGLPYIIYQYISNTIIYTYETDHEKHLQIYELLQMLNIDDYWLQNQFWLTSSFTQYGRYFRLHILLLKSLYLIIFIFIRYNLNIQVITVTIITLLFCCYYSIGGIINTKKYLPYRNNSSNIIVLCIFSLLIINTIFGMFNQFEVKNAITVSSTESYFLWACSFIATIITIIVFIYQIIYLLYTKNYDWNTVKTLNYIYKHKKLISYIAEWVQSIREAYIIRADFILSPIEVADINSLENIIKNLRKNWLNAHNIGSIFEIPISTILTELLYIHSINYSSALRRHPYWNNTYINPIIRSNLQKRYYKHSIMTPKKRRILLKLLAYRYLKGNYNNFNINIANKQIKQNNIDNEIKMKKDIELLNLIEKRKKEFKNEMYSKKFNHFNNFAANAQFLLFGQQQQEEGKGESDASRKGLLSIDSESGFGEQKGRFACVCIVVLYM